MENLEFESWSSQEFENFLETSSPAEVIKFLENNRENCPHLFLNKVLAYGKNRFLEAILDSKKLVKRCCVDSTIILFLELFYSDEINQDLKKKIHDFIQVSSPVVLQGILNKYEVFKKSSSLLGMYVNEGESFSLFKDSLKYF